MFHNHKDTINNYVVLILYKKNALESKLSGAFSVLYCDPCRIQTCNPHIRSVVLYSVELMDLRRNLLATNLSFTRQKRSPQLLLFAFETLQFLRDVLVKDHSFSKAAAKVLLFFELPKYFCIFFKKKQFLQLISAFFLPIQTRFKFN